jgi:hypothetical protein
MTILKNLELGIFLSRNAYTPQGTTLAYPLVGDAVASQRQGGTMSYRMTIKGLWLALLWFSASGCVRQPEKWSPVLEETSVDVLQTKTEKALNHLHVAQEKMQIDPVDAKEALDSAEEDLRSISAYYLPLLDARERSYKAYRFYCLREKKRAVTELDRIEQTLTRMAEDGSPQLVKELDTPLEGIADARTAILADPEAAPELLRELATKLNLMFLKIELVLQGTK